MDNTVSVSKGVFVFNNGAKAINKSKKSSQVRNDNIFSDKLWYKTYSELWQSLETKIQNLNNEMFLSVLKNFIIFIKMSYQNFVSEIPAAALLTGINVPDHEEQYITLAEEISETVTPHVVRLHAQDCQNLKSLIENMVYQFITDYNTDSDEDYDSDDKKNRKSSVKKTQCTLSLLQAWYEDLYYGNGRNTNTVSPTKRQKVKNDSKVLVLIIPDFEGFSDKVLQQFILVASSYLNILPFVFVFGIATSLAALHRTLPYNVISKINVQVFNSPKSVACLNNVLENVLFSKDLPFHLGGKVFNLFIDIFLFYNFSVTSFIQNFKYSMLEHFSRGNAMSLCSKRKQLSGVLDELSHDDLEDVRRLLSFRRLVERESYENQIKLLTDDEHFKSVLRSQVQNIHRYMKLFHIFLKCLHMLVADLPKAPLGKHIRELYSVAVSSNIAGSKEYKECFQLLNFQSKDEFYVKISKISMYINEQSKTARKLQNCLQPFLNKINGYLDELNMVLLCDQENVPENGECEDLTAGITDRQKLKQVLLEKSKKPKSLSRYELIKCDLLAYLSSELRKYLHEPELLDFHELFFFNDMSIKNQIVGSHRAAIHAALNDPYSYFKCSCCEIPNDYQILKTMPDICIVYKLHLECGKMINLYDWLQAFLSIVDADEDDEDGGAKKDVRVVDPNLQARFTQAVAELEFLGLIKNSKRKADHVARLTWGR